MSQKLLSAAERYQHGQNLRRSAPREAHGELKDHKRDPVAILSQSDSTRVPSLLSVRYERMMADPFAFLRGAAAVMAADLAHAPQVGLHVQACGDCHLMNFGAFGSPENNILFDINDFDESLPGVDFTVDIKRLATSFAVAGEAAGLSPKKSHALAASVTRDYRKAIIRLAKMTPLQVWHSAINLESEIANFESKALRRKLGNVVSRTRGTLEEDDNFPHLVTGSMPRIVDKAPLIYHFDAKDYALDLSKVFSDYSSTLAPERRILVERYKMADIAFKVVGVGSVGTFCAVGLFLDGDAAPLFLQIKQAQASVLERLAPHAVYTGHQGQRVVEGQRMLQAASDVFLGWTQDEANKRQFYIRQLKSRRLGGVTELLESEALTDYAGLCGRTLARAHARSGDPAALAGYLGNGDVFDEAMASFAMAYAKQTVLDHAALVKAKTPATKKKPSAKADVKTEAKTSGKTKNT